MHRRQFLCQTASFAAGTSLTGCGWTLGAVKPKEEEATSEASQSSDGGQNGELRLYTWSSYIDDELLKDFSNKTGIKVIADYFDSNEMMLATLRSGKGGAYSIIYPSEYKVVEMARLGLLRSLDPAKLPGLKDLMPRFQSVLGGGDRYHVPFAWGTTGFIYNRESLNPPPTDWSYLWTHSENVAHRVTLINDVREVMGGVLRSLGYSYNATNPQEIQQAYEKLVALKPVIVNFNTDAWQDQLLAGDLVLAMGYSTEAAKVITEDVRFQYLIPAGGTSLWVDTMVIPKAAPNIEAAYQWINYMLDPEVSATIAARLMVATPNQVAYNQLPTDLRENPALFPQDSLLTRSEGILPIGEDAQKLYDRYWLQLLSS